MDTQRNAIHFDGNDDSIIKFIETKDQLIELFMSCVPEKENISDDQDMDSNYFRMSGFNHCIEQMIKNLEKLK